MWIGDIIVIISLFALKLHGARTFEKSEERISEKIKRTINGEQFDDLVSSNLCDVCNAVAATNEGALLYRSVFNLIPNENLTNVPVSQWATLCSYFNEDIGFTSKVLATLKNDSRREEFLTSMAQVSFAGNYLGCQNRLTILQAMAEDFITASRNDENALNLLLQNHLLLLSAPSYFLFNLRDIYKAFLLAYAAATTNPYDDFWKQQPSLTKRIWSEILLQRRSHLISFIKQQKNIGFFQILSSLNMVELLEFLTTLHADRVVSPVFFSSIDWNIVQIRKIVDLSFEDFNNSLAPDMSYKFLSRLLPVQIVRAMRAEENLSSFVDLSQLTLFATNHLQNVDQVSLPQALQLSECFMALLNEVLSATTTSSYAVDESVCALIGKLLYSQTNSFLSQLNDRTLKMKTIKCLDSNKYSILQAHYILGPNGLRDVKDYLLNFKGLIAAIPASYYVNLVKTSKRDSSLENHFVHILKYFPPRANKIAAWAALQACKTVMDAARCIESVLENCDNEIVSTLISPLDVRQNVDNIWNLLAMRTKEDNEFKQRVAYLPNFVLTELLRKKELIITYDRLFNETLPIYLTIMGLDCDILSRIPISHFLSVFEFYNRQRRIYNKEFPKDLQKCARDAFLTYLRMKSKTSVAQLKNHILQYLELADIRSVGGYVLTTLPTKSIITSKHRRKIVEEIGRLSLPELMLAAPRSHLVSIASQYLNETAMIEQNAENIRADHLISLGNLTHFLNDNYVRKIDASALKLVLEAELIDTRVCASLTIRKAWAGKLIEAFGPSETWDENTFLKIGDMLIVMDDPSFSVFNRSAGLRVADLMISKYKQVVEWIPRRLPFFEVCCLVLPQNEQIAYESSVKRLALYYAMSIERLLNTIVKIPIENARNARLKNRVANVHEISDSDRMLSDSTAYTITTKTENEATTSVLSTSSSPLFTINGPTIISTDKFSVDSNVLDNFRKWPSQAKNIVASTATEKTETTETWLDTTTVDFQSLLLHARQNDDNDDNVYHTFNSSRWVRPEKIVEITQMSRTYSNDDEEPSEQTSTATAATITVTTATAIDMTRTATTVMDDMSVSTSYLPDTRGTQNTAHSNAETTVDVEVESENGNKTGRREIEVSPSTSIVLENETKLQISEQDLDSIMRKLLTADTIENSARFEYRSKRDAGGQKSPRTDAGAERGVDDNRLLPNVGCNTLKILDTMSEFIVGSPQIVIRQEDTLDCIELLARMDSLSAERRETIWFDVASKLSDANSTFVAGKILSAVSVTELTNFTYDVRSAGVLELIGALSDISHVWSVDNREKLVRKILRDNDENNELLKGAQLSVFTRALGKLVCQVSNPTFFRLLKRNDALSDVWNALDAFTDCPMECLKRIANTTVKVYGDPLQWEPSIVTMLGPVAAAIPKLFHHSNISRYLSASAFRCLRLSSDNQHLPYHDNDASVSTSVSLTSSMLLMENDCVRTGNCSFISSLAGVVLTEDSLQLSAYNLSSRSSSSSSSSSTSTSSSSTSSSANLASLANVTCPVGLLLLHIIVVLRFLFGKWLFSDRG